MSAAGLPGPSAGDDNFRLPLPGPQPGGGRRPEEPAPAGQCCRHRGARGCSGGGGRRGRGPGLPWRGQVRWLHPCGRAPRGTGKVVAGHGNTVHHQWHCCSNQNKHRAIIRKSSKHSMIVPSAHAHLMEFLLQKNTAYAVSNQFLKGSIIKVYFILIIHKVHELFFNL